MLPWPALDSAKAARDVPAGSACRRPGERRPLERKLGRGRAENLARKPHRAGVFCPSSSLTGRPSGERREGRPGHRAPSVGIPRRPVGVRGCASAMVASVSEASAVSVCGVTVSPASRTHVHLALKPEGAGRWGGTGSCTVRPGAGGGPAYPGSPELGSVHLCAPEKSHWWQNLGWSVSVSAVKNC